MSWHKRDLVLPQQRSCLATTHILSCHNRDLVLPQQTSCLATIHILSCHNRDLVLPLQTLCLPRAENPKGPRVPQGPKGPEGPRVPKGPKGAEKRKKSRKTQCLLWQDKISVVARQDVCCGKTRSLLWQDKISLVPRHKGIHKGARREAPRPFVEVARSAASFMDGCGEAGEAQGILNGSNFVATSLQLRRNFGGSCV